MEGYHDGSTDIPVEHAEVCTWDIAERELDEGERTITVHGSGHFGSWLMVHDFNLNVDLNLNHIKFRV